MAIVIPILTEYSGKGIAKAKKEFEQLEGFGEKAGFILKQSMVPIAGLLAGVGTAAFQAGQELLGMAQAAAEDQKSQEQLAQILKKFTKATDAQVASVEDYIDKTSRATAVADDELRPAFGRLARSVKKVDDAQRLLNLALDIAATTGKPLLTVSDALAKSYDGQDGALGRLGLGLDKTKLKAMDFEQQTKFFEERFAGGAAKAADTFEGKMQNLRNRFSEIKEAIGYKLLPYLELLADKLLRVSDAFNENGLAGAMIELQNQFPTFLGAIGAIYDGFAALYDMLRKIKMGFGEAFKIWKLPSQHAEFQPSPRWADIMNNFSSQLNAPKPNAPIDMGGGLAGPAGGINIPRYPGLFPGGAGPVSGSSLGERVRPQQVNVTVTSADPRAVVDALVKYNRQNGAIPVTVGR